MLIFDIETVADTTNQQFLNYKMGNIEAPSNYTKPEAIEAYKAKQKIKMFEKLALSPLTGKIVCAGFISSEVIQNPLWQDITPYEDRQDEFSSLLMLGLDGKSEEEIILQSLQIISSRYDEGHSLVTYRGSKFDLPFLFSRALIKGIAKPEHMPPITDYISKYPPRNPNPPHIDLYNILNPNYGDHSGLSEWAYLLGDGNEPKGDGDKVQEWFDGGQFDLIKQHCIDDIYKTLYLADRVLKWLI